MEKSQEDDNHQSVSGQGDRPVSKSNSPASSPNFKNGQNTDTNDSTPKRNDKAANAFAIMMMSGRKNSDKKRKRNGSTDSKNNTPTTSRFVLCPAGCGKHILPHEMNKHLDACLLRQATNRNQDSEKGLALASPLCSDKIENVGRNENLASPIVSTPTEGTPPEPVPILSDSSSPEKKANDTSQIKKKDGDQGKSPMAVTTKATIDNPYQKPTNAFAHMMKRSIKVFSEQETTSSVPKLFERLHLDETGRVTLICYNSSNHRILPPEETIAWSATVQVRGKKEGALPPIDLLVSSSLPSWTTISNSPASAPNEPQRVRLVRNHSRISVPVLKSILQKGIRRRKPLPSVRVASELADKSLGDLLRRLPIIILEDSTLHPSLPLLVWLMVAVSKDYQPPLSLLKRVLGIVFEMASCRWQDSLRARIRIRQPTGTDDDVGMETNREFLSLSSLHKKALASRNQENSDPQTLDRSTTAVVNDNDLLVWSILMRGQYGGMAGDIRMLQGYAELWYERFHATPSIPDDVKKRLTPGISASFTSSSTDAASIAAAQNASDDDEYPHEWNQVPAFIHKEASKHSECRVDRLLMVKSMAHQSQNQNKNHGQQQVDDELSSFVGLPSLSKLDLTPEGVDFHCSSVLESAIFSDANLVRECFVQLMGTDSKNGRLPPNARDRHAWLEGLLKSCMWTYSGGVNFRLPLVTTKTNGNDDDNNLKAFYGTFIRPRVEAFSKRYIEERLSKR